MLKEVGASGQISLGKKYAGQLFDVVFAPDGRVELVPMKAVPTVGESRVQTQLSTHAQGVHGVQEELATYRVGDGWLTRQRNAKARVDVESTEQWAEKHAAEIDQYNAWANQHEPYSQRVRRRRESVARPTNVKTGEKSDAGQT